MKNGKTCLLKSLWCEHPKIFKVCLAFFIIKHERVDFIQLYFCNFNSFVLLTLSNIFFSASQSLNLD